MSWAVCFITSESPIQKWTVVAADSPRAAANMVRRQYSMSNIRAVYKAVEEWRRA